MHSHLNVKPLIFMQNMQNIYLFYLCKALLNVLSFNQDIILIFYRRFQGGWMCVMNVSLCAVQAVKGVGHLDPQNGC